MMAAILQDEKCYILLRIPLIFVPMGPIDKSSLVQNVARHRTSNKISSRSMMSYNLT